MDICGTRHHCEWDSAPVANNMALRARFCFICRIRSGFVAPFLAGMLDESKEARSQSIWSASPNRSKSIRCSRFHTPASCHSCNLLQQVTPEPQPISWGSISQGMPLFSTKMMPVRAARSFTRGLPPSVLGGSGGNSGSTISQSSSVTNSLAMFSTYPHSTVLKEALSAEAAMQAIGPAFSGIANNCTNGIGKALNEHRAIPYSNLPQEVLQGTENKESGDPLTEHVRLTQQQRSL